MIGQLNMLWLVIIIKIFGFRKKILNPGNFHTSKLKKK